MIWSFNVPTLCDLFDAINFGAHFFEQILFSRILLILFITVHSFQHPKMFYVIKC